MKVILYSTGCPRCHVLKQKLLIKKINYIECNSIEEMKKLGIDQVPMLSIDGGALMTFGEAIEWINNLEV